ncbi:MAG: methyltransferase, partial [Rhabdochlamydiaceae bacterium]
SRITPLVKDREDVMVMFAGVGPFAIEIAKAHPKTDVVAIELNKNAYKYMLENIKLNKVPNVRAVNGNVKTVSKRFDGFADRIVMPTPTSSLMFLDQAVKVAKKRCIVHIYAFGSSESAYDDVYGRIKEHAKENGYRIRLLLKRAVRPYSAKEVEIVLDYLIRKRI